MTSPAILMPHDLSYPLVFDCSSGFHQNLQLLAEEYAERYQGAIRRERTHREIWCDGRDQSLSVKMETFLKVVFRGGYPGNGIKGLQEVLDVAPELASGIPVPMLGTTLVALLLDVDIHIFPDSGFTKDCSNLDLLMLKTRKADAIDVLNKLLKMILPKSRSINVASSCESLSIFRLKTQFTNLLLDLASFHPEVSFWTALKTMLSLQFNLTHLALVLPNSHRASGRFLAIKRTSLTFLSITSYARLAGPILSILKQYSAARLRELHIVMFNQLPMYMNSVIESLKSSRVTMEEVQLRNRTWTGKFWTIKLLNTLTSLRSLCIYHCPVPIITNFQYYEYPGQYKCPLTSLELWHCSDIYRIEDIKTYFEHQPDDGTQRNLMIVGGSYQLPWLSIRNVTVTIHGQDRVEDRESGIMQKSDDSDLFLVRTWRWINGLEVNSEYIRTE